MIDTNQLVKAERNTPKTAKDWDHINDVQKKSFALEILAAMEVKANFTHREAKDMEADFRVYTAQFYPALTNKLKAIEPFDATIAGNRYVRYVTATGSPPKVNIGDDPVEYGKYTIWSLPRRYSTTELRSLLKVTFLVLGTKYTTEKLKRTIENQAPTPRIRVPIKKRKTKSAPILNNSPKRDPIIDAQNSIPTANQINQTDDEIVENFFARVSKGEKYASILVSLKNKGRHLKLLSLWRNQLIQMIADFDLIE